MQALIQAAIWVDGAPRGTIGFGGAGVLPVISKRAHPATLGQSAGERIAGDADIGLVHEGIDKRGRRCRARARSQGVMV